MHTRTASLSYCGAAAGVRDRERCECSFKRHETSSDPKAFFRKLHAQPLYPHAPVLRSSDPSVSLPKSRAGLPARAPQRLSKPRCGDSCRTLSPALHRPCRCRGIFIPRRNKARSSLPKQGPPLRRLLQRKRRRVPRRQRHTSRCCFSKPNTSSRQATCSRGCKPQRPTRGARLTSVQPQRLSSTLGTFTVAVPRQQAACARQCARGLARRYALHRIPRAEQPPLPPGPRMT